MVVSDQNEIYRSLAFKRTDIARIRYQFLPFMVKCTGVTEEFNFQLA